MKKFNLLLGSLIALLGISFSSCSNSNKDTRDIVYIEAIYFGIFPMGRNETLTKSVKEMPTKGNFQYACLLDSKREPITNGQDLIGKDAPYRFDSLYFKDQKICGRDDNIYEKIIEATRGKDFNYSYDYYIQSSDDIYHQRGYCIDLICVPDSMSVTYLDVEDASITDGKGPLPIEYCTLDELEAISKITLSKPGYIFNGWNEVKGEEEVPFKDFSCKRDLVLRAKWTREGTVHKIKYENTLGLENNNPTTFYTGDLIYLDPLPEGDGYKFKGWYYNGEKVTSYISTRNITSDITVTADIELFRYEATFVVDDKPYLVQPFTFLTSQFEFPEVPSKAGMVGSWDIDKITEMKDIVITAQYDTLRVGVNINTGIEGYSIPTINLTGVHSYQELFSYWNNNNYTLKNLYFDTNLTQPVNRLSQIISDVTLYARAAKLTAVSNYLEFIQALKNSSGAYYLTNDIDFEGNSFPVLESFSGCIDGRNHKIKNITLNNSSNSKNYAMFKSLSGVIKNLDISVNTYVYNVPFADKDTINFAILTNNNTGEINNVHITTNNTIGSTAYISIADFSATMNAGMLASQNNGVIIDSSVDSKNTSLEVRLSNGVQNMGLKEDGVFTINYGGLVGLNNGIILSSSSKGFLDYEFKLNNILSSWSYTHYTANAGGLVGLNKGTILSSFSNVDFYYKSHDIYREGLVLNDYVGGLVGVNNSSVDSSYIKESTLSYTSMVHDNDSHSSFTGYVGGLVASNTSSITKSFSDIDITSKARGISVSGFSTLNSGSITNSYSSGNILFNEGDHYSASGFVYKNSSVISNCYSSTSINNSGNNSSSDVICGFIITNTYEGNISRCFSYGDIEGTNISKSHRFGIENLLGFSFLNYCASDSIYDKGGIEGYFDNCAEVPQIEMKTTNFLNRLSFSFDIWEVKDDKLILSGVGE